MCLLIFGGDWPTTVLSVWSMICLVGKEEQLNGDDPCLIIFFINIWPTMITMMFDSRQIDVKWKQISCPLLFLRSSGEIGVAGKKGQFLVCRTNWVSSFLLSSPSAPGLISSTVRNQSTKIPNLTKYPNTKYHLPDIFNSAQQSTKIPNLTKYPNTKYHLPDIKVPKFQR